MKERLAFVSMPGSEEFKDVSAATIKALEEAGYRVYCFGEKSILAPGRYWQSELLDALASADVVVADVTGPRYNVIYEIGYAHGQRKPVILIGQPDSLSTLPGYLMNYQVLLYEPDDFEELTYLIRRSVERLTSDKAR
jgi:ABC-type branched-subunit amino acid transport system substrate-binding protein